MREKSADADAVDFRLLGPLEVSVGGRDVTPTRPKQRALLALLLLRANEVLATDEMIDALWGEQPPATAPTVLQGHVSALRKLLGSDTIETRPPATCCACRPIRVTLDASKSWSAWRCREPDAARRAELHRTALDLFRGEPLSDLRYETFVVEESRRIEEARLASLEERIEAELDLGHGAELVAELERLVASNPFREHLRGHLMLALYRAGQQPAALRAYQDARHVLAEELGLEPGPWLQQLEGKILAHDASLTPSPPASRARPMEVRRERKVVTVFLCELSLGAESDDLDPEDTQTRLGCGGIFALNVEASHKVPQISLILGPAAGAAAYRRRSPTGRSWSRTRPRCS